MTMIAEGYDLKIICGTCGYESKTWMEHMNHGRDDDQKHTYEKIVNTETGESVASIKKARERGWMLHSSKKGREKEQKKIERETQRTSIKGEVLETKTYIHPYVYELFIQSMSMFDDYENDDQETFSRFILDLAIFYRLMTNQLLPWGDTLVESLYQKTKESEEEPREEKEKEEVKNG